MAIDLLPKLPPMRIYWEPEESSKAWCDRNWDLMCQKLDIKDGDLFESLYDQGEYYAAKILLQKYL